MTAATSNFSNSGLFNLKPDSRTADWPLVANPLYTLGLCLSYVYTAKAAFKNVHTNKNMLNKFAFFPIFVIFILFMRRYFRLNIINFYAEYWKKDSMLIPIEFMTVTRSFLGPKIMENKKPFQLKNTLILYNLFQVLFSVWLFYEIGMSGWFTGEYSFKCQPVDYSNKPSTIRMVHASWWYFFSKFTEFADTLFFVLRKKFDHISTLHVIHHGIMPMSVWFGVKYCPGGHSTFFGLLNTFVHIVMYFYYFLTALGPQVQKYLWWKKYLTTLQMVQFVAIMVHAFQLLFIDCNYPKVFAWWIGSHAVLFFFLFKDFYQKSYKNAQKALKDKARANEAKKLNGAIPKQNGTSKTNGVVKDASDYYVNGVNGSSQLHQRLKDQ